MVKSHRKTEIRNWITRIECTECHQILPADTEHYFKWDCALWLRSKCKNCVNEKYKEKALEYREKNREKINTQKREAHKRDREIISERRRVARSTKEFKEKMKLYTEKHRDEINKKHRENRQKDKRWAKRLRTRKLIKKLWIAHNNCSICWIECKAQAHHPSYDKWNEIIFLCPWCHNKIHAWWFECPKDKIIDLLSFKN